MGLLTTLLTLPVSGPVLGVKWVLDQVVAEAERELYDEDTIRGRIAELGVLYDTGQISEEEFEAAEDALFERLREARERQRALDTIDRPPSADPGSR